MRIFISYSREDTGYKDKIEGHLSHLSKLGGITLWHDGHIEIGDLWKEEIEKELRQASAAILLVSTDFLGSAFCQDEEVRILLQRRNEEGIKIYPIIIRPCNWNLYPWLKEFEVGPEDNQGRVKPLSRLSKPRQEEFYTKLCGQIHTDLAKQSTQATGEGRQLQSTQEREQFAQSLASRYCKEQSKVVIKELAESYIWLYRQGLDKPAFHLVEAFDRALKKNRCKIDDDDHRDLLALFKAGLPVEPVHLKDLSSLDVNSLLDNPGYPTLMLGIRLIEKNDYQAALNHLLKVSQERPRRFSSCALITYALGQSYRKLGHLDEAARVHDRALRRISDWESEYCECGPRCSKEALLVEIHRGLGAVFRKLERWKEAEKHFEIAKNHLTDQLSPAIKSDFLYSYGYYIYERAVKEKINIGSDAYLKRLLEARELFEESSELRLRWDAPLCRLQMVKQLLGEKDYDYWTARVCSILEPSGESGLTAIVSGFAILTGELGKSSIRTHNLDSRILYKELEQVFRNRLAPKGMRVCHAFDAEVIRESRALTSDPWLLRVYKLLQESAHWNSESLAEQRKCLEDFRRTHRVPKSTGKGK